MVLIKEFLKFRLNSPSLWSRKNTGGFAWSCDGMSTSGKKNWISFDYDANFLADVKYNVQVRLQMD